MAKSVPQFDTLSTGQLSAVLQQILQVIKGLEHGQQTLVKSVTGLEQGQQFLANSVDNLEQGQRRLEKNQAKLQKEYKLQQREITGIHSELSDVHKELRQQGLRQESIDNKVALIIEAVSPQFENQTKDHLKVNSHEKWL